MKLTKRVLALLLVLAMVLVYVPVSIFAEEVTDEPEEVTYIQVKTIEDLYNIRNDLTANYILMNDIDLTEATAEGGDWDYGGRGWNPIGSQDIYTNGAFSGIFDGNGHKIIGMRIHAASLPSGATSTSSYAGLFAYISGTVRNLHMENVNISDGCYYTGAIAGYVSKNGTIEGCSVSGSIANSDYAGSIAGINFGTISSCFNLASVSGYYDVGGIAGENHKAIANCYNAGDIKCTSTSSSSRYAGGIAGRQYGASGSSATITNCYNIGNISSAKTGCCYAIAYNADYSQISNSYYKTGSGFQSTGATALTEAQMKLQTTYSGFNFDSVWFIDAEAVYPYPQLKTNPQETRVIQSAKIATMPEKVVYLLDDALNMSGCTLEFTFANAETEYVTVTNDMVTGYNGSVLGEQTLTISCYGRTFTFTVTVEELAFVEIRTILDLYNIRYNLSGNYILMNDIDLTEATAEGGDWDYGGRGWNPIGSNDIYSNSAFSGIFDGNGHKIIGMRIHAASLPSGATSTSSYAGLFAYISGTVRNLHMENVNISDGCNYTGAIAGYVSKNGTIEGCSVSGSIANSNYAGSIAGKNFGTISNCFNLASVSGYYDVGGIAGENHKAIANCYNAGDIKCTYNITSSYHYAGGIAGRQYGASSNSATITNCYNIGNISSVKTGCCYAIAYNDEYYQISNSYYKTGSGFQSTGATVLTEAQMRLQDVFAGFDFDTVWTINAYANYPYPQLQNNIQDMREKVDLVRVIAYPAKLDYLTGDELMLVGGLVEVVYTSGKIEMLAITEDMVSGYDPTLADVQTITVTIGDKSDTFEINVTRRPGAVSMTLVNEPAKKQFVIGTAFDFTGAQVQVVYDDDTTKVLDVTLDMTTGGDINHLGNQTITVTVDGQSVTFTVKVIPASLGSISVAKLPNKTTYLKGEQLDTTGLEIIGVYTNGTQIGISSGYTVSGYNSETVGTQTITVNFAGKTATFDVTVEKWPLATLAIQTKPTKLEYTMGEKMDLTGLVVIGTRTNGDEEIIDDYTVSGFDTKTAGAKAVKVQKDGFTDTFTIFVIEPAVGQDDPQIFLGSKITKQGSTLTVTAEIKNNPGFAYLELTPFISPELTLVNVQNGQLVSDFTKDNQYIWVSEQDVTADGVLMTFTFLVDENVPIGSYMVGFSVRTCANFEEEFVQIAVVNAEISVVDYVFGDATGDGIVDGMDVIRLKKYLAAYNYETDTSTVAISDGADATGDGVVDGLDVIRLKKYLAAFNYETGTSPIPLGPQ